MKAYERLIKYSTFATTSDESSETCPSTPSQLEFARYLKGELEALGLSEVTLDENGYLFATLPASEGHENAPVIGFIAHMDVSPDVSGENIKARAIKYEGGDILLNEKEGIYMREAEFSSLKNYIGKTLVVTDGTTLLGADDKAGIAEIITACELFLADKSLKHGKIRIGFTPDEEIGRGADLFDVARFGAKWAYTLDGGAFGEVEYETFNAFSMSVKVKGKSIHPGSAKDKMINASVVANEFFSMFPEMERPEHTEGYEGFYHLVGMSGEIEAAELDFILRDHDFDKVVYRCEYAQKCAEKLNKRYGDGTVTVNVKESYRNMKEKILPEFHLVENAMAVIRELGVEPVCCPVRGGTDGCRLSFMGLPCPNLGTGGHNFHGCMEYACADDMEKGVMQIIKIAEIYSKMKA